jgi:hypothetical protein
MTTNLDIESLSNDNNNSLFRSQRVKTQGKEIITPVKTLESSKFRSAMELNNRAFGINEIYRELEPERISILDKDSTLHDGFTRDLRNLKNKARASVLNLCMIKYRSEKFSNLKEKNSLLMWHIVILT